MTTYGAVLIDIDLGIGRQYGYRDPARHAVTAATEVLVPVRNPAVCHPERTNEAHGLCDRCYPKRWREAK